MNNSPGRTGITKLADIVKEQVDDYVYSLFSDIGEIDKSSMHQQRTRYPRHAIGGSPAFIVQFSSEKCEKPDVWEQTGAYLN